MEADTIYTWFKKLTPKERNQLTKEGKCFYCKKPGHMAHGCPSYPKQRFPPKSQPNFRLKHQMMRGMEEEGNKEDNKEGKNRVTHIQQIIMCLSMEELTKFEPLVT